jgi:transmembrane sensor
MRDEPMPESVTPAQEDAAEAWLVRLASGAMSAEEMAQFQLWLAQDVGNCAAFAQAKALWQGLAAFKQDFAAEAQQAQRSRRPTATPMVKGKARDRRQTQSASPGRRGWLVWAAVVALIVCGVGISALVADFDALVRADHHTGVGEQMSAMLPDGSLAHLNTDTAIAVQYTPARRVVRLIRGEAEFVVTPEAARPFQVAALDGLTEATGIAFIVRKVAGHVLITVTEGTVTVSANAQADADEGEAGAASRITLQRGQQVSYGGGAELGDVHMADLEQISAWRHGKLIFDRVSFAEAIAELDRYRPGRILLVTPLSSDTPVGGIFRLSELDDAIAALAATRRLRPLYLTSFLILLH